ncbi:hypothetical protein BDQ17DRAFT_1539073 [Cyathus striatus]|nr:hypothetical protein BDQ17DRAFT_1539073 [Cyathus striatus]
MAATANSHSIFTHIERLSYLTSFLPDSITVAKEDSMINRVFTTIPVPSVPNGDHWPVFNQCMDILFGEDRRNTDGNLLFIQRGQYGMDLVVDYIRSTVKFHKIPFDIADIKVKRLVDELEKLTKNSEVHEPASRIIAEKRRPSVGIEVEDEDYSPPKQH